MRTLAVQALDRLSSSRYADFEEALEAEVDQDTVSIIFDLDTWSPAIPCPAEVMDSGYLVLFTDGSFLVAVFEHAMDDGMSPGILVSGTIVGSFASGADFLDAFAPSSSGLRTMLGMMYEVLKITTPQDAPHSVH